MKIKKGKGTTEYGKGVDITLSGEEVARAIMTYLTAKGVYISGARTITVNGELCESGKIYIDPSAFCIDKKGKKWNGKEM
jgi:hypothetical protein